MENVPLAAGANQFWKFVRRMESWGYAWTAGIINAALRGSSQSRQRLVYIAIRGDVRTTPQIRLPTHGGSRTYFSYRSGCMNSLQSDPVGMLGETPATQRIRKMLPYQESGFGQRDIQCVEEILDDLPKTGSPAAERLSHRAWAHTPEVLRRMKNVPEGGRWQGGRDHFSQSYGRLHRLGLARTITTYFSNPGSGRFWHPKENRALTLREAARIQGFPDSFGFLPPYSRAAVLVGNALDGAIAKLTFNIVRTCIE
jgi:DNA (cytosine-5)-methyltransferase 1